MELLDRYLQAVKRYLPSKRQDDILAELRANLESQFEEKEAELGRPMTTAEREAWIKQLGSPMQMAARYQSQQYLIGPAVFPVYWFVLRTAVFWAAIIYMLVGTILAAVNASSVSAAITGAIEALMRTPGAMLTTAAWVTLIFAVIELISMNSPGTVEGLTGWPTNWSPATLPPLEKRPAAGKTPGNFAKAVSEVIFGFLFLIWMLLIPKYPFLLFGPGVYFMQIARFQLAPVWVDFYWSMVALNIAQTLWRSFDLWSGRWQRPRTLQRMAFKVVGLIPLLFLINAPGHVLVSLKDPSVDPSHLAPTIDLVNRSVHQGFLVICAIVILTLLWELVQAGLMSYRKREAA